REFATLLFIIQYMPDWQRIIVGDAFKASSRDPNYYRDLLLIFPLFVFSSGAIVHLLSAESHEAFIALKFGAIALALLLAAKERMILLISVLGFCAFRLLFVLVITQDWRALAGLLVTGFPLILILRIRADYEPSYQWPGGITILDLVFV